MEASGAAAGAHFKLEYVGTDCAHRGLIGTLNFWYHMYGMYTGVLALLGSSGEVRFTNAGQSGDTWHQVTIDLMDSAFSFHAFRGPSWSSDIAVDDVSFNCVHAPPPPPTLPPSSPPPPPLPLLPIPPGVPPAPHPPQPPRLPPTDPPSPPVPPLPPVSPPMPPHICIPGSYGGSDDASHCAYLFDGDCDDGGFGAEYALCAFASDCHDCGPRDPRGGPSPPAPPSPPMPSAPPAPYAPPSSPPELPPPPSPPPPPTEPPSPPMAPTPCSPTPSLPPPPGSPPPSPPPPSPPPPASPPHPPFAPDVLLVNDFTTLNATLWAASTDAAAPTRIHLQPGALYSLVGREFELDAQHVELYSSREGATLDAQHLSRVFALANGASLTLTNLRLINGRAHLGGALSVGGGSSLSLFSTTVAHSHDDTTNFASGGALYVAASTATLTDSSIADSYVRAGSLIMSGTPYGGCVSIVSNAVFRMIGSSLARCSSTNAASGSAYGGAMYLAAGSTISLEGSTVMDSTVTTSGTPWGGCLHVDSSVSGTFAGSTITGCVARSTGGSAHAGAVMAREDSVLNFTNSTISNSLVEAAGGTAAYGGAFDLNDATVNLVDSVVSGCVATNTGSADSYAGGFSAWFGSHFSLLRSTVSGCSTGQSGQSNYGGAAIVYGSTIDVIDSQILDCSSGTEAGALYLSGGSHGVVSGSTFSGCSSKDAGTISVKSSQINITDTNITNSQAIDSGSPYGGCMAVRNQGIAALTGVRFEGCAASSDDGSGTASGGALNLAGQSSVSLSACAFVACTVSGSSSAFGGAMYVSDASTVSMTTSTIDSCVASATNNAYGGAIAVRSVSSLVAADVQVTACGALSAGTAHGHALSVDQRSTLSLTNVLVSGCSSMSTTSKGGALFLRDSTASLAQSTHFHSNSAAEGSALYLDGRFTVDYQLPAPPGTWLPATACEVYREACPTDPPDAYVACQDTFDECKTISGATNVSAADGTPCTDASFNQPCGWHLHPEQIGQTVFVLPAAHVEIDFPYSCSPGLVGSSSTELQLSPMCSGLCPAGLVCPVPRTTTPSPCPRGSYCRLGSATPVPCPGGTYNNVTGATTVGDCMSVPATFWAPLGSALPEPCPSSGFYCPGAAADTVNDPPGSKPIIQATGGSTTFEEVETVTTSISLDLSIEDFMAQQEAIRIALAADYGVPPESIILDAAPGSLQLTITVVVPVASPPPPGVGSANAPPSTPTVASSLLATVASVDAATLGASLGSALGLAPLTVTVTGNVSTGSVMHTVLFVCPKGKWCTAGLVVDCPENTFNNLTGQEFATACHQCPTDSTTDGRLGATDVTECVSAVGFFTNSIDGLVHGDGDCVPCPTGAVCNEAGQSLVGMEVRQGYYRLSSTSADIKRCADFDQDDGSGCIGGE